jgi:hypothetical protein
VLDGLVGAYPNAFYRIRSADLSAFTDEIASMKSPADYSRLAARYAIESSDPEFWAVSDRVVDALARQSPVDAALPDYGRFELR